jgi:hypothetical protein
MVDVNRPSSATRLYALSHPLALAVAAGAAIAGFLFLALPGLFPIGESALAEWLPAHFIMVWAALYFCGGTLILVGILSGRPNIEAPGFVLLGAALLASTIAVFSIRGINPGLVAGSTIGPCAAGCLARAVILVVFEPRISGR